MSDNPFEFSAAEKRESVLGDVQGQGDMDAVSLGLLDRVLRVLAATLGGLSSDEITASVRQDSFRYEPYLHVRIALAWAVKHGMASETNGYYTIVRF